MPQQQKRVKGFTIIELLIVITIVGILVGVGYPSYNNFIIESNRTEGQRELMRIANLQEQYYVDTRAYTTDLKKLGLNASPYITENGYYSIAATVSGDTFVVKATAKSSQTKDTDCLTMSINETGQRTPSTGCWGN